jgi:hypothetical protein
MPQIGHVFPGVVPIISVILYTLSPLFYDHVRPALGLLLPACHSVPLPRSSMQAGDAESAHPDGPGPAASPVIAVPDAQPRPR